MSIPVPKVPSFPAAAHTLTSLGGLRAAGVRAGIKASGNPDLGLLVSERSIPVAGIFTQNHFAAAPVLLSKKHLAASGGLFRALVVNSGNANACTGAQGEADAHEMCARVAARLGCPIEQVLVCSTGVIGVKLPMDKVRGGIDAAFDALAHDVEAGRRFLAAIMTTDAFPKEASVGAGAGQVAGVCKGAGMIEPNMATMLAFVGTDFALESGQLREALPRIAAQSFNAVHVDTHTSTNDTLLLLATGQTPAPHDWEQHVTRVAHRLSWLIARDGEGATKVTTIEVTGAASDAAAQQIGKLVAASALVRTALYGNDPNWGRFTSQVGNSTAVKNARALTCVLQGIEVFRSGEPTAFDRAAASRAMAQEDVRLELKLADGAGRAVVLTSDLGYRYVQVNAEYTT
ncbi:MAG: bifunctional glutamate N-acetyltransferase/amino-acid acetyltransferase ArgJ [Deltaproteobacteria bacterium]|nr:bifunctional glutamate N-acetyltransferase/amino-acid acetyltransferase ArgJ [Deltaproteobacteria bacterium]